MEESELIKERKESITKFLKKNYSLISYVVLAVLVWIAVKIRTSNLPGLKDITTGSWTLGPDLDPFLFLRWTQYIVENGHLMAHDAMRYVPLGFNTAQELALHSYMIAWFHKIAVLFGSDSVTLSAVLYPAFMFGLAMVAFFLLARKIFIKSLGVKQASIIALVATFFISVIPALLPRTIAGIPEKEAGALPFMFLAFYFFLVSWDSENKYVKYLFAVLAGASTGVMALVWGGSIYVYSSLALATFVAFILGQTDKRRAIAYGLWVIVFLIFIIVFSERFSFSALIGSVFSGAAVFMFALLLVDQILFKTKIKEKVIRSKLGEIPRPLVSILATIIIAVIVAAVVFGPGFLFYKASEVKNILVTPVVDRLGVTVAENRQPYFSEWESSFGPHIREIAITFWLFFIGSIHLFYFAFRDFKKDRGRLTAAYALFLIGLVFSRYSESSTLNGTNMTSLVFYAIGPLVLIIAGGYYYFRHYKTEEGKEKLRSVDFSLIFLLAFFIISLVSARSAVRLIMMLVPAASIIVGYFAVAPAFRVFKVKDSFWKIVSMMLVAVIIIATIVSAYGHYNAIKNSAPGHVPSIYTQQWQKAMAWVRANTPENAVFGHWWDYGYWVQTIGERATVLDGGNSIPYWNHLMGRYALTGPDEREALEFLYVHNTTHFLIDSTDIGKYSAFSSIGSDANYDRASFIPAFLRDDSQVQEKKNSTVFIYMGGTGLDGDIVYEENGTRFFLPSGRAGLGAVLIEKNQDNEIISNPRGIFVYEGQQYNLPFRYAFDGEFRDFGYGIESGVFLMPQVEQQGNNVNIKQDGALLYLSERVVKSQLARLYLYKQDSESFKLVHSEDDFLVSSLKTQGAVIENDIVYFGGVRGPIRIWEITYPEDIDFKEEYLETVYPSEDLWRVG
jgi:dolichyl-diphosphooligosaccharide--protein glycosyltransferase